MYIAHLAVALLPYVGINKHDRLVYQVLHGCFKLLYIRGRILMADLAPNPCPEAEPLPPRWLRHLMARCTRPCKLRCPGLLVLLC